MSEKYKFEVIIGTYEQFIVGYKLSDENNDKKFVQSFANHSHHASIKSVHTSGKWLASSGNDETIYIYDMLSRQQSGCIMEHNGTVTCVAFTPDASHLISASEDGNIAIFRTGSWKMEKIFKGAHKGLGVTSVAIHPSGKMAMSLGKDLTLRTWNLVKGRPAFITNLSRSNCKLLESIAWSPGGDYYAIPMNNVVELFSVNTGGVCRTYNFKKKINAVLFLTDILMCVGEEDGSISGHSTETGNEFWRLAGKERVRCLASHKRFLVAANSTGTITAYRMKKDPHEEPKQIATVDAKCRITCLTLCRTKIGSVSEENVEENEEVTKTPKLKNQPHKKRKNSQANVEENEEVTKTPKLKNQPRKKRKNSQAMTPSTIGAPKKRAK